MARGLLFRHCDAAMLRASASLDLVIPGAWPDPEDADGLRGWLIRAWGEGRLAEAVWLASPPLAARIDAVCAGAVLEVAQIRRMALALARYLVRAERRATPFGMFAGVAGLDFGPVASADVVGEQATRTRPDAEWLAAVVARLEAVPELRRRLTVQANNLAAVRGLRLTVPRRPHATVPAVEPVTEWSVLHTRAVRLAVQLAAAPLPYGELADKLAAEFSAFPPEAADTLVAELVTQGLLITNLRPASTVTDPLHYILGRLGTAGAANLPELVGLVGELHAIRADLQDLDRAPSGPGGWPGRAAADRMRAVALVDQPLVVDLRLADRVVVAEQVAVEAAVAADVLARLSPYPSGRPEWQSYRDRFIDRYGASTLVPLAELVDPVRGLGYPAHYTGTAAAMLSVRDERLFALAQQALLDGVREVMLDDAAVAALAADTSEAGHVGAHIDLRAEVRAASLEAMTAGRFVLAVTGVGRSAMALSGRFLDVLPVADQDRMMAAFDRLPVTVDGAIPVQLSFPPHTTRPENVLRARQVLPDLVCLAEHREPAPGMIGLNDLAVCAERGRLVLVSSSRRQVIEPTVAHAGAEHTMPLLGRFLLDLPRAGARGMMSSFDWGAARSLPFRPAIRYGRILLSAARWRIDPARLPSPAAPLGEWTAAWTALRERLRLPVWVHVGSGDRRLRLHLGREMDLALLRAHLDAAGDPVTLVEATVYRDLGWLGGRAHEVLIPLTSTAPPASVPAALTRHGTWPPLGPAKPLLPGSGMLSAKVDCDPQVADLILTRGLPALLGQWEEPPPIWFLRMAHPVPHLRIRLHTTDYGQAAVRIGQWAADLRRRGLVGDLTLDTYHPETGRYGTGEALAAAEALFVADSTAVLAQLATLAADRGLHRQAFTAASLVDLAGAMLGSRTAGCEWLIGHPHLAGHASLDRAVLRRAIQLVPSTLDGLPSGIQLRDAWEQRWQAAGRYATALDVAGDQIRPDTVLVSLLHLHHVRTQGPDPAAELLTHRLARAVALATVRRRTRSEEATP